MGIEVQATHGQQSAVTGDLSVVAAHAFRLIDVINRHAQNVMNVDASVESVAVDKCGACEVASFVSFMQVFLKDLDLEITN